MSLYNMINGVNPLAGILLRVLNLSPDDVGRFRDCYLSKENDKLEIHVFTRNGGGNRDDYADITEELQSHPEYIKDFDDDFDCTYATYTFNVPDKFLPSIEKLIGEEDLPDKPMERFKSFINKMEENPDDPDVKRVMDAMKPVFEKITEKIKDLDDV